MKLSAKRIVLTGAAGGLGRVLAEQLATHGVKMGLVDLNAEALDELVSQLHNINQDIIAISADLTRHDSRARIVNQMQTRFGGIDMLINNAGIMEFREFVDQDPAMIDKMISVNVTAPMQLTHDVLPGMLENRHGQVVNIGSTFGSIAFACFASYSATKFAMRGFSEALRRELEGSGVNVTYIAPRAIKTPLNSPAVYRMAEKVKMNMDEPADIARAIIRAIEQDKKDSYLGFPESLFVRINAVLPRLVDGSLRKQNQIMREYTHEH
jgi:short-subunit dehydrogenase